MCIRDRGDAAGAARPACGRGPAGGANGPPAEARAITRAARSVPSAEPDETTGDVRVHHPRPKHAGCSAISRRVRSTPRRCTTFALSARFSRGPRGPSRDDRRVRRRRRGRLARGVASRSTPAGLIPSLVRSVTPPFPHPPRSRGFARDISREQSLPDLSRLTRDALRPAPPFPLTACDSWISTSSAPATRF